MKKLNGPEIYDLVLNIVILGFLIAIIVLLIKCQRSKRENFSPIVNSNKQEWKNGRFYRPANFINPESRKRPNIPTAPIQLYNNSY
tara:strand:- start:222 stop:479 length:258 start_codon:yes stop_codon:yes gene_type:complete